MASLEERLKQHALTLGFDRAGIALAGEADSFERYLAWLASEECSFSTAATFDISGGRTTF